MGTANKSIDCITGPFVKLKFIINHPEIYIHYYKNEITNEKMIAIYIRKIEIATLIITGDRIEVNFCNLFPQQLLFMIE